MLYDQHLTAQPWSDYELLDSGENMKLERFGGVILARPETQALWRKRRPEVWEQAHAAFAFKGKTGRWEKKGPTPESWEMGWNELRFEARLTSFKHTGVFPEQSPNWQWLGERIAALNAPKVLNLFGYTGIATLAAAKAGASVTHVDASKQSLDWANLNAKKLHLGKNGGEGGGRDAGIRWVADDALAFAKREARRGKKYDGIILDPPAFGRGAKGEVWKIEENLPGLLMLAKKLLNDAPGSFFLLNGYAAGYASRSLAQAVEGAFGALEGESGELHIKEAHAERVVPAGIYARFIR